MLCEVLVLAGYEGVAKDIGPEKEVQLFLDRP